jgi:hypothetical protein
MAISVEALLADVQSVAQLANLALELGEDAAPFVAQIVDLIANKQTLTDAQRATLLQQEAALRAKLQAPLTA